MMIARNLLLISLILVAIISFAVNAQQQQEGGNNNIEFSLRKGNVQMIDFFLLLSKKKLAYPGMVVNIDSLPKRGKLFGLPPLDPNATKSVTAQITPSMSTLKGSNDRSQLLSMFTREITEASQTRTSRSNMFLYVSARNASNALVFDAYDESFAYSVDDGNFGGGSSFAGQGHCLQYCSNSSRYQNHQVRSYYYWLRFQLEPSFDQGQE